MQIPNTIRTGLGAHVYNRTIYLRVQPVPETFSERRAVLRILQRSGEVQVFKKLRRDDSFISIMRSSKDAIEFVKRAPIRYELVVENRGVNLMGAREITPSVDPIETTQSPPPKTPTGTPKPAALSQGYTELQADEPSPEELPAVPEQQQGDKDDDVLAAPSRFQSVRQRSFVLSAFITNRHAHYTHIRRSRLYGSWEREQHARETFMTQALRKLVPNDHDNQTFVDWITGDQLNESRIEEHDEQKRSGLSTTFFEIRRARRQNKSLLLKNKGKLGQTFADAEK